MAIIKQQFTITYERSVDTDTGEILKTEIVKTSDTKKTVKTPVKDSDTEPKVYLEDNKLRLNSLAVELLGVNPDDRLDVQYTETYPVIGKSEVFGNPEGGTKLTKSYTLSFRGKRSETLQKFGTEFKVIESDGRFILDSGKPVEELKGDENIDNLDLEAFLDGSNEVKASMFQL